MKVSLRIPTKADPIERTPLSPAAARLLLDCIQEMRRNQQANRTLAAWREEQALNRLAEGRQRALDREALERATSRAQRFDVELSGDQRVNLCPRGEKLIACTCLPEDSIIVWQLPTQVEIVEPGSPPRR